MEAPAGQPLTSRFFEHTYPRRETLMVRQSLLTALTVSLMLCLPLADSWGRGFGGGGHGGGGGGGGFGGGAGRSPGGGGGGGGGGFGGGGSAGEQVAVQVAVGGGRWSWLRRWSGARCGWLRRRWRICRRRRWTWTVVRVDLAEASGVERVRRTRCGGTRWRQDGRRAVLADRVAVPGAGGFGQGGLGRVRRPRFARSGR